MAKERKTKAKKLRNRKLWLIFGSIGLVLIAAAVLLFLLLRPIEIETVSFQEEEISLKAGELVPLVYSYLPEDATKTALSFKSSNRSVATVENGVLTAVGEGSCYISITAESGAKDKVRVSVDAPMVEREVAIVGAWGIFAVQREGKLEYVYNDSSILHLTEERSGSLTYGKEEYAFPDWRLAQTSEGYDCFTVRTDSREELSLYFCTDSASAYENCLMLRLSEGELLLFRRLPTEE